MKSRCRSASFGTAEAAPGPETCQVGRDGGGGAGRASTVGPQNYWSTGNLSFGAEGFDGVNGGGAA